MHARVELAAKRGDFSSALKLSLAAAQLRPRDVPDFKIRQRDPRQDMQYGESLMLCLEAQPYEKARKLLSRLRRMRPETHVVFMLSGIADAFLARFKAAEKFLDRAIALSPCSWSYAWRGVARALEARRLKSQAGLAAALSDLDRAVELGGTARQFVYPWRAELRHDLEDMAGALSDLDDILARDEDNLWARVERGEILCETGRHAEALAAFDRLVQENPRSSWAFALRGRTLATTGREEESLPDLEKALALDPGSASAHAWISEALRKLGRYREALEHLDSGLRLDPRFILAWVWRGRIQLLLGRHQEALRDLNRAARLDPRYQLAFAWRGEVLFKLGRIREAARDFERIAPMDPLRTWNPVLTEGQRLTPEARERSYWDDLERAVKERPRDASARRLREAALGRSQPREALAA